MSVMSAKPLFEVVRIGKTIPSGDRVVAYYQDGTQVSIQPDGTRESRPADNVPRDYERAEHIGNLFYYWPSGAAGNGYAFAFREV